MWFFTANSVYSNLQKLTSSAFSFTDDNWVLIDQNFTGCINDCENGTFTEIYSCNAGMGGSCQGINDFLPRASNGTTEEVERAGICSQQLVCQSKYLLDIFKTNIPFQQLSFMF